MSGQAQRQAPAVIPQLRKFSQRRVALVHYWLVAMRGGERVLERLLGLFPDADIFTHVHVPEKMSGALAGANVRTSFINGLPFARRFYQYYLPLMPLALEELDLSEYDLVISSEAGPAKGVITNPASQHLCYCHSPMRYLWDQYHPYKRASNPLARLAMPLMYHNLRQWDVSSSARVDTFAANSRYIRDRIRKVWRREAEVVHPPVETSLFTPSIEIDDTYLWVGQMVPYKRPDLAVEAFNANGRPLLMVGTGAMTKRLRAMARPNIKFVDRLDFNALKRAYARTKAFVITAEEDFGITPVETMASGRPVLAFGRGGALDTVLHEKTGLLFDRQDVASLNDGIEQMEKFLPHFDPNDSVRQAECFKPEFFDQKILGLVGG